MRLSPPHYCRSLLFVITVLIHPASFTFASSSTPVKPDQPPQRIMPLGNSITQGNLASYRRLLWLALKEKGLKVDFVGSLGRTYSNATQAPDYDVDHEGHWGWLADEVLDKIDDWATQARPDIVLLHLGTNDIGSGQDTAETVDEISQIVAQLRNHNPRVQVLLAAIIPLAYEGAAESIKQYNAGLADLSRKLNSTTSRVLFVDQFSGFNAELDTYDGVHPNDTGNQKMAAKWFAALTELLNADTK